MICNECGSDKSPNQFYRLEDKGRIKIAKRCKLCYSKKQRTNRLRSPHRLFSESKANAERRDIGWNISAAQFSAKIKEPCAHCGDNSRLHGIDRIDNEPYYSDTNTVSCCGRCNSMKSDMTRHQFLSHISKILMTANAAIACDGK